MYDSKEIANLIRQITKNKAFSITKMLNDIGIGKNTMSHLDNGSMIKADSLGKIADYLDVSVDYLLGRTNEANKKINYNVGNNNINNQGTINNNVNSVLNEPDNISKEMIAKFEKLEFSNKIKVMSLISELSQK